MKLSRQKADIAMARKCMKITDLAKEYGVSRSRMNVILNQQKVTPQCAGRIAQALGVDVTEILVDE